MTCALASTRRGPRGERGRAVPTRGRDRFVTASKNGPDHTDPVRPQIDDPRLTVLVTLGRRLRGIGNAETAANEVVRALAPLGLAASVATIHSDVAVIEAINVPQSLELRLPQGLASRLVGMRIPLDGVEAFRMPVQLHVPYHGPAGAAETLRSLTASSDLVQFLPAPGTEGDVVSVPVMQGDTVAAVLSAWGPGVEAAVVPTIEAAAAMLAASWGPARQQDVERFPTRTPTRPNARLRRVLDSILMENSITAAVQPIVRLHDGSVIGYEALARFAARGQIRTPDELFACASSLNMQNRVDLACLRAALAEAPRLGGADLFVNVLIGTLLDRAGLAALNAAVHEAGVDPESVVLEFSEREPVTDLARLQRIAAEVRSGGFRIAVDDAGAGHASMRVIAELRPEFIKVDRSLIHAVDSDRARKALVVALLSFSGHIGARLIAEGIETKAEEQMLSTLGVMFGQGWLPGKPVLCRPIEGLEEIEVVDDAWFARQHVSRTREMPQAVVAPAEPQSVRPSGVPSIRGRGLPRALSSAALALQNEHDPVRIVGVMAELMMGVVPVSEMAIFAADYETHRMVPMYAAGTDRDELLADSFSLDAGLTGWAFARGKPENVPDTSKHPLARQVPGTPVVDESLLLIPLVAGEHKLGIINCWRLGLAQFSDRELEAASLFAHIAAAAWRNAQLYAELLSAAMTDPLTRLYNSRWLRDTGDRDLARAAREGKPLALLLVDLDHFKMVNDGGGHAAGDLVLQRVASRLRSTVRGMDAVVRLGGEEFVALLQDCDADGASVVAEAVRVAVRDIALPEGCGLPRLTASVGIAAYPEHAGDLEQLLAAADRAMYSAKQAGRDRIARAMSAPEAGTIVPLPRRRRRRQAATRRLAAHID
jgi:diguanylate cyclase (GGDEF)-like protein